MLPKNIWIIMLSGLFCVYCSTRTTYRDQVLLHTMRQVEAKALARPSGQLLFEGAMGGMLEKMGDELGDVYSEYVPPSLEQEHRDLLDSRVEGIGVRFDSTAEEGTFKILFPIIDSPAYKAGIQAGDVVLKVDDEETKDFSPLEISKKIRGPAGTAVELTVLHPGEQEPVDISITRSMIQQKTVFGFNLSETGEASAAVPGNPSIGYVYIASFNRNTSEELFEMIRAFPPSIDKLILDLRGNPGGYLDVAVEVADFFVNNRGRYREIVTTRHRDGTLKENGQFLANDAVLFFGEMLVLIDGGSASAAEIVAACLQDFGRAKVLGERSYGKGTVQEIFVLPFHLGEIKLTDASYWRPSGRNINRVRVLPKGENGEQKKLSEDSDDWGVTPDPGLEIKLSRRQRILTLFLRDLRSFVPTDKVLPLMQQYSELLSKDESKAELALEDDYEDELPEEETPEKKEGNEKESGENEKNAENEEKVETEKTGEDEKQGENDEKAKTKQPFQPEGTAPFYDPVLDKAIELLKTRHSAPTAAPAAREL